MNPDPENIKKRKRKKKTNEKTRRTMSLIIAIVGEVNEIIA